MALKPLPLAFGLIALVLVGVAVAQVSDRSASEPRRLADEYRYPQDDSDSAAGIALNVTSADFSGTGTFVRLEAHIDLSVIPAKYSGLTVSREDVRGDGLTALSGSNGGAIDASGRATLTIRLAPPVGPTPDAFTVHTIMLHDAQGSSTAVTGPWRLTLRLPDHVTELLAVETFAPLDDATHGPVEMKVISAVRSNTEFELLVEFQGNGPVEPLAPPPTHSWRG